MSCWRRESAGTQTSGAASCQQLAITAPLNAVVLNHRGLAAVYACTVLCPLSGTPADLPRSRPRPSTARSLDCVGEGYKVNARAVNEKAPFIDFPVSDPDGGGGELSCGSVVPQPRGLQQLTATAPSAAPVCPCRPRSGAPLVCLRLRVFTALALPSAHLLHAPPLQVNTKHTHAQNLVACEAACIAKSKCKSFYYRGGES